MANGLQRFTKETMMERNERTRVWYGYAVPRGCLSALVALLLILGSLSSAYAVPAPAGTSITNSATATYDDGSGATQTTNSNEVRTLVQQVAALTLIQDRNQTAVAGAQVVYSHTLTNTGNGSDTFTLSLVNIGGDDFDLNTLGIFAGSSATGTNLLNGPPITLASGASFLFVVKGNLPNTGLVAGNISRITITATSAFNTALSATNTDTTTVTTNGDVNLTKTISPNTGPSPSAGPVTITLTYRNVGATTARALTIFDVIPAGMTYVPNSGRWTGTGGTVLTDSDTVAQGTGSDTIVYDFGVTTPNRMTAVINEVPGNQERTLTFQVTVNAGLNAGPITNTATFTFDDGTGTTVQGTPSSATYTVGASVAVVIRDTGVQTEDNDGAINDVVTINAATPGSTVLFTNLVQNTGNITDTFNITVPSATSTFPVGSQVVLTNSSGTQLVDTNNDSIPDTGPLTPNATFIVILRMTLPSNASGGPLQALKRATSIASPAVFDTVTDRLLAVSQRSLTLVANQTGQVSPGGMIVYTHTLTNTGIVPEGGTNSTIRLGITDTPIGGGFLSEVFVDSNGNNQFDPGTDARIDDSTIAGVTALPASIVLAPNGGSVRLFVKVTAPSAPFGTTNSSTLVATTVGGTNVGAAPAPVSVVDVTTITAASVTLVKGQALDSNCDGTELQNAATFGIGDLSAKPGECVCYAVRATNVGTSAATNVMITDATPQFTKVSVAAVITPPGTIDATSPGVGSTGLIKANFASLGSGSPPVTLTFCVKIDQ